MLPRLPAFELADRAQSRQRRGEALIPMTGVPVLPMPEHIQSAADTAMRGVFTRAIRGHIDLRRAISERLASGHNLALDPEREILITHGAQHGLSVALRALLEPGDEIIIPAPTYFFDGLVRLAGALRTVELAAHYRKQKMAALVALEAELLRSVEELAGGNVVPLRLVS